jgi:hypothetical protein
MRAKEQLADDLQGRLRLLISMEEKRKSVEQSAFKYVPDSSSTFAVIFNLRASRNFLY